MKNTFGFYQGAQPGLNNFGQRLISAATGRQTAQDSTLKALAAADAAAGKAAEDRAQAARIDAGSAALADEPGFISNMAGLARPLAQKATDYYRTGNWGTVQPLTPNDDEGNPNAPIVLDRPTDAPAELTPTAMGLVNRARQLRAATLAGKESTPEQIAKAGGEFQGQAITDQVQGDIAAGLVDRASARNQGGKLGTQIKIYDNMGNTGATFRAGSGGVSVDNPLAQSTITENLAKAQEASAKAANAGNERAPNLHPIFDENGNALAFNSKTAETTQIIGPDGKPVQKKNTERAMPGSAIKGLQENQASLRQAQKALSLISGENVGGLQGSENATGFLKGVIPDAILNRDIPVLGDPQGVDARAAIADIGSLKIHDRSGAAVTASEFPRLRPFVPMVSDSPEVVKKKLTAFVQEYQNIVNETQDFYRESGYKVPDVLRDAEGNKPSAKPPAASPAPAAGGRPPLSSFGAPAAPAAKPARSMPGQVTSTDRLAILQEEYRNEAALQTRTPVDEERKQANLAALAREIKSAGGAI